MHSCILKGITTALLVTILTLCAGIAAGALGFSGLNISGLVDIGLLLSCLIGGYRAAAGSGEWLAGGITGAGYVAVGTLLLALFFPIRVWGFIQVLGEGALIGGVAGAFGAGGAKKRKAGSGSGGRINNYRPDFAGGYGRGSGSESNSSFAWDTDESFSRQDHEEISAQRFDSNQETIPAETIAENPLFNSGEEWSWDDEQMDSESKRNKDERPWWE